MTFRLTDLPRPAVAAFQIGKADAMVDALLDGVEEKQLPAVRDALSRLAQLAVELRRESVAVLGNHEAFVRHTPDGALHQVIRPVQLSMSRGEIYQITRKRPYRRKKDGSTDFDNPFRGRVERGDAVNWEEVPADGNRFSASLTYPGLVAMNAVAGCQVGQPPKVWVDGEERMNPYMQRSEVSTKSRGKRLGDIIRVVIAINVVGPAPATGNPVVTSYTLDYDPTKDLLHMLASVANTLPQGGGDRIYNSDCYLIEEDDFERAPGWTFVPLYGGVGYAVCLRNPEIRKVYADFTNILQNALKKAQTVARRNAMRNHPAIGGGKVTIDEDGNARVAVVGWAGDAAALGRWITLAKRLANNDPIDDLGLEVVEKTEVYEPDTADELAPVVLDHEEVEQLDEEAAERGALIQHIEQGILVLGPEDAAALEFDPAADLEDLRRVRDALNEHADQA